ncbi:MAG: hypothetical protein CMN76_19405 [Spirochaetaceae bacterium]|nr:hypothetical protein [Spirochaetaceae bacterium]
MNLFYSTDYMSLHRQEFSIVLASLLMSFSCSLLFLCSPPGLFLHLAAISLFKHWWGGHSPGPRLMADIDIAPERIWEDDPPPLEGDRIIRTLLKFPG